MNFDRDYYAILCVSPSAEDVVIRAAYSALAQRYHPDRASGAMDQVTGRMAEINEAYGVLSDPEKRRQYDLFRAAGPPSSAPHFAESTDNVHPGEQSWVAPHQERIVWTLLLFSWFLSLVIMLIIAGTLAIARMPFPSLSRPVWVAVLVVLSAMLTWAIYKLPWSAKTQARGNV